MERYHLVIPFWGMNISEDFELRYTLVDYIEQNLFGEVYEEGTSNEGMHLYFAVSAGTVLKDKIEEALYNSVGKSVNYNLTMIK